MGGGWGGGVLILGSWVFSGPYRGRGEMGVSCVYGRRYNSV